MAEWPPTQYPWEIKPQVYGPYQTIIKGSKSKGTNVTGLGAKAGKQVKQTSVEKGLSGVRKGTTHKGLSSSMPQSTTTNPKYTQGLSSAIRTPKYNEWFRTAKPKPVTNVTYWGKTLTGAKIPLGTKPASMKPTKGPSALARRGAVGLSVIKHGTGGGSGAFSK
tara:strand:- start:1996 stop:2487 length:492 start_codon:yes stop_codon:yes gene_type:complete